MKIPYDEALTLDRKLKLEYGLVEAGIMTPNEYRRSVASEYDIPKVLNCPNCGAPITGYKCEYCGTVFKHTDEMNYNTYESLINSKKVCQYLSSTTCCEQETIHQTPQQKSFIRRLLNR